MLRSSTFEEGVLAMRGVPSNPVTWQNSRYKGTDA